MAHQFKIGDKTVQLLSDAREALEIEMQEHRDAFDERSERWQGSDVGSEVDGWIENVGEVIDALNGYPEEPDV